MSWRKSFLTLAVVLALANCSKSNTDSSIPSPTDPSTGPVNPLPNPTPTGPTLPEWVSDAASILLPNSSNYSLFETILQQRIDLPVVGDPLIAMELVNGSTTVNGKLHLGIEDKSGFKFVSINQSVTQAGQFSGGIFNGYWSDDIEVFRVSASYSGSTILQNGQISYRLRASTDPRTGFQICDYVLGYYNCRTANFFDNTNSRYVTSCPSGHSCTDVRIEACKTITIWDYYYGSYQSRTHVDVAACQSFMNPSSSVQTVGTFEQDYTKWVH